MAPRLRPTQASLAAELGVSRQTISNVVNNPELVKPATRRKVEEAIAASGYRPSLAGRALRTRRSGAIGMRLHPVVDGVNGEVLDRFVHAVTEYAQRRGYRITLFTAADATSEVGELTAMYHQGVIDGAVLVDTRLNDPRPAALTAAGLPFVVFGRPWGDTFAQHCWVDVDGRSGVYGATQHLRSLGHDIVGFIGWPRGSAVGDDRREGWLAAGGDPAYATFVEDLTRLGFEAAQELRRCGATAVVCTSDSLALGALPVFAAGARPHRELPVIGFDNTPVARATGMCSIGQPVEEAADLLLDQLLDQVQGSDTPCARGVLLTPSLELRQWESIVGSYPSGEEEK